MAPESVSTDVTVKVSLDGLSLDEARARITRVMTDYFIAALRRGKLQSEPRLVP